MEKSDTLEDVDFDLAVLQVPEALHEEAPLQAEGSQEQVDAHTAEPVSLQEGHEEAEADEDHDVNVLKHCRSEREVQLSSSGTVFITTNVLNFLNQSITLLDRMEYFL